MRNRMQVAGIAGIVFVAAGLAAGMLPGEPPDPESTPAQVQQYLVDNSDGLVAAGFAQLFAAVAFLWFLAAVVGLLRRTPDGDVLGGFVYAGGIATLVLALVAQAMVAAPVYIDGAARALDADVLYALYQGQVLAHLATAATFVVFLGGLAYAGLRHGVMPKLPAWIAAVGAGAALVTFGAAFEPDLGFIGFLAFLLFLLFALVLSIYMVAGKVIVHGETPLTTPADA